MFSMKRLVVFLGLVTLLLAGLAAGENKTSDLKFLVIRDYNGKPVRNASVILHPIQEGKQKGGLQLKTDPEGKTGFEGVPYGTLRIQVLAQGFQTFGQDYEVNQPTMDITIRLKRPTDQYSIYDDKNQPPPEKKDDKGQQPDPQKKEQK